MKCQPTYSLSVLESDSGFSLAELMVTVAILGILLAVAIPIFSISIESQRKKDCEFNRNIITSAINRAAAISGKNLVALDSSEPDIKITLNRFIPGSGLDELTCNVGGSPTKYVVENGQIQGHTH